MKNMVFLVEILGMTNYCNLDCDYCDWEKYPAIPLDEEEMREVKRNLTASKKFIQRHYPGAQMIEYSGGEPYMYPQIVAEVLRTFPEYWVRVITNGLKLTEEDLTELKSHGKACLAVSLDGETLEKNCNRFHEQRKLDMILANIERALAGGIPVMILCTLNRDNIDGFPEYLRWVSERWQPYIDSGMLVLPAHLLTVYSRMHRPATEEQMGSLQNCLKLLKLPVYRRIEEHYQAMHTPERACNIYRWCASMHFLKRSIAEDGAFVSYRCGMRGIGRIGQFGVKEELQEDTFTGKLRTSEESEFRAFRCRCFVDWTAFDLIFDGTIPPEHAGEWFILFRDEGVLAWIRQYQQMRRAEDKIRQGELLPKNLWEGRAKMAFDSKFFRENIDAVFFDLYGTLMEDHCVPLDYEKWGILAQFYGYSGAVYQPDELAVAFGKLNYEVREQAGLHINPELEYDETEVFRRLYAQKGVAADERLVGTAGQVFRACSTKYCRLYPGAKELILALRKAGKKVCLLSNAQRIYTEPELKMNGIYDCFDALRLSSDWGVKKPSWRFFEELIDWTKVSPSRILMVGNDAVADICPARSLHMYTCYIHSNLSPKETAPPCNIYLEGANLGKLQRLLLGE